MAEWNIHRIGGVEAWKYSNGSGVIFASADTGVDWTHPILNKNYAGRVWTSSGPAENSDILHDYG